VVLAAAATIAAQKSTPADVAGQLSGKWTINTTLSPGFKAGRGRAGGADYALGGFGMQRGRGGGGASDTTMSGPGDLTPTERVERTAMAQVEQLAPAITIKATADTATFTDQRGEQTCAINDKTVKTDMFDAHVNVKCRWNKSALQQEFSTTRTKLTRMWAVDENGRLVVKSRLEDIGRSPVELSAVYDRNPS
jgi:hypothetical protein